MTTFVASWCFCDKRNHVSVFTSHPNYRERSYRGHLRLTITHGRLAACIPCSIISRWDGGVDLVVEASFRCVVDPGFFRIQATNIRPHTGRYDLVGFFRLCDATTARAFGPHCPRLLSSVEVRGHRYCRLTSTISVLPQQLGPPPIPEITHPSHAPKQAHRASPARRYRLVVHG